MILSWALVLSGLYCVFWGICTLSLIRAVDLSTSAVLLLDTWTSAFAFAVLWFTLFSLV
jgi:hypothetical protein